MGVDFWGGFWCGVVLVSMLWVITLRPKSDKTDYKWSDKNWHPDYVEPRKSPRVLKKTVKK